MIYCDTSVLVAALTLEPHSEPVLGWLNGVDAGALCISGWVVTEFSSAIALKVRLGVIPAAERDIVLANWHRFRRESLNIVPVRQGVFGAAAQLCEEAGSQLRSGDALHLAIAIEGGHQLATLDKVLAQAAQLHGVELAGPAPNA